MAYTITKTDGTTLVTLADGTVDQLSSSLSLLGRNVNSYGQYYNDNLIGLLENFASTNEPKSPIQGQLWYNKIEGRMYVYSADNTFKQVTGTILSATQPTIDSTRPGDIWIDTTTKQLFFSPDGSSFLLAGPPNNVYAGKNGAIVETILQQGTNIPFVVVSIYSANTLLGIIAPRPFVFASAIGGTYAMTSVQTGFNLNTSIPGIRFVGTATSADSVIGYAPLAYLRRGTNETTTGTFAFRNNEGVSVGVSDDISVAVDNGLSTLRVNTIDMDLSINLKTDNPSFSIPDYSALYFDSFGKRVGVFTTTPTVPFEVEGDTLINGNLVVTGATSYISSTNLQISDKNVELAFGSTLDTQSDGGGITLHGSTDHTLIWQNDSTGWNTNDNFNLPLVNSYMINGNTVMTATSIGSVVTSAPGLTSVGVLTYLTITNVLISGNTVSALGNDQTLFLTGTGAGTVDVESNRITSVATPLYGSDSATKKYVDDSLTLVGARTASISIDITGMSNPDQDIIVYLNSVFPITNVGEPEYNLVDGTRVMVLCSFMTFNIPQQILNLRTSTVPVDQNGIHSAVAAIFSVAGVLDPVTSSSASPISYTVTRTVRKYKVVLGVWVLQP